MRRTFVCSAMVYLLLMGVSSPAAGQDTATIVGTVTDTTGAVIPRAKVVVSNPEKGFLRQLESNLVGDYTAAKIPIGDYVVTAEAHDFQRLIRSGITLEVGQTQRVDLRLAVGQMNQEVTVTRSAAKVETEDGTMSNVVTGKQITSLELNGRNFTNLYALVPGAVQDNYYDPTEIGILEAVAVSFNGNRTQYNNLEIDGGNDLDEGSGGNLVNTYPSLDAIAEFRVSTSNYGADMGKHAGAQIELATKSGTKDFHGTLFEFFRNDHLDANDWFANRRLWSGLPTTDCKPEGAVAGAAVHCNAPKTRLLWNDYGYNVGGPVYIPGHFNTGKSKLFFFWSQNWRAYRQASVISNNVPSELMRQGNFSECDSASPNYNPVAASGCVLPVNPTTAHRFPNDTVSIDPNAQALLNGLVPLPNNGPVSYISAPTMPTDWREELIRADANISSKVQLFVRYAQDTWNTVAIPSLWSSSVFDTVTTPFAGPAKSAVLNLVYNFEPNLVNELVMAYSADHVYLQPKVGQSSPAGSIDRPSGWTMDNLFPANASNPLLPAISVSGGTPFSFVENASNLPWTNGNPIITMKDNLIYARGKHTLKMGFFFENYRKNEQFGFDTQGFLTFSNSSAVTTGNALADMYLGRIAQYEEGTQTVNGVAVGGYPRGHWRSNDFEPYVQDDWKVTRRLTLNLGVRYYYFRPFHDVSQPQTVDSGFLPDLYNPTSQTQLYSNGNLIPGSGYNYTMYGNGLVECGHNGVAAGCRLPNYATLAPRFGFAYDPTGTGKTAIRGGYGIYFESGNGNESNTEGGEGNPPVSLAPSGYNIVGYNNIVPGLLGPGSYIGIPYREKWGSVQQFNFGVQHEFPGNNVLEVSYVGSLGRHLATQRNLNQVPVGIGTVNVPSLAAPNNPADCDSSGNCNVQAVLINNELGTNVFFVPYRGYSTINIKQNTAVAEYNALQVNFRHPFGHGLTFQGAYTWSHNIDDSTSYFFSTMVDDNYDLSRWRGTSDLNRTNVLVLNYVYDLSFLKNASNAFVKGAIGGWQISGITSFFSGEPVESTNTNFGCSNVVNPSTGNTYNTGIGGKVRCNTVGPLKIQKGIIDDPTFGPTPSWYDPNVVTEPSLAQMPADGEPGMFGYMGRNVLTGPGRNNWDMALLKNFRLPWFRSEHSTLQFRWETFNTFNHPQWKNINAGCSGAPNNDGTAAWGRPCGGNTYNVGVGEVSSAWPPRIMQFSLKFLF